MLFSVIWMLILYWGRIALPILKMTDSSKWFVR